MTVNDALACRYSSRSQRAQRNDSGSFRIIPALSSASLSRWRSEVINGSLAKRPLMSEEDRFCESADLRDLHGDRWSGCGRTGSADLL